MEHSNDAPTPSAGNRLPGAKPKMAMSKGVFIGALLVVAASFYVLGTRYDPAYVLSSLTGKTTTAPAQLDLSSVQSTYDALRQNYDGELDANKLVEGATRGMVEATGDPYTTYLTDEEAKSFYNDLEGQFTGIGAELGRRDNKLYIVSTLDDSPAKKAGLLANDVIIGVNDQEAADWTVDRAVSQIRGEKGTTVKLSVLREQEVKEFSIVRDAITNPSVKSEITANNVGVMRISRFGETDTYALAKQAAENFKANNVSGVVLDLRGNGGGYLEAARQLAGLWLEDKVVVTERTGGRVTDTLKTGTSAPLKGIKTVILVDGGSASASEILAGALKDHNAATLVGQKTFGKGSVQSIEDLPGGGQLKVTVAKWYTPKGVNISKEGIEPDHKVELTQQDVAASRDPQKDKALELAR